MLDDPAPPLRLLVLEGNGHAARARLKAAGGTIASEAYRDCLLSLHPASIDIATPADADAQLPCDDLRSYDGVFITGSALNIYDRSPEIERQIALVRQVYAAGVPVFGSCWGIQVATVAAGGVVRRNPKGREWGIGRRLRLTPEGLRHPMFMLKGSPVFDALAIHYDEVETLAPGSTLLATNDHSQVQAVEIRTGTSNVWAVQYHPEFSFRDMAMLMHRQQDRLVSEGFCASPQEAQAMASAYAQLHEAPQRQDIAWRLGIDQHVLDPMIRTAEIAAFLQAMATPRAIARECLVSY